MPTLDERLRAFRQAQADLYDYIGISRKLAHNKWSGDAEAIYQHGSGNDDIPTPYPELLDYRRQPWMITETGENADDEVHVMIDEAGEFEPNNIIRFNILTILDNEDKNLVCVMASHLPKPDELHYAHSDQVDRAEAGENVYGDTCVLLLTRSVGQTTLSDYADYTG